MPELEAVRIVADWLESGTNGIGGTPNGPGSVNALLPLVPRDASDGVPPAVTLYDATRYDWVARLKAPAEKSGIQYPALVVFVPTDATFEGEVATVLRDGMIDVAVMWLGSASETAATLAAALYTARGVMRSLRLLNDPARVAFRTRNDITLWRCEKLRQVRGGALPEGLVLSNGIIASYHVRDSAP